MLEEVGDGDECMDVKPWMNNIKAPTTIAFAQPGHDLPPRVRVELDYCYGYRSK